jgi:hypothetical protein
MGTTISGWHGGMTCKLPERDFKPLQQILKTGIMKIKVLSACFCTTGATHAVRSAGAVLLPGVFSTADGLSGSDSGLFAWRERYIPRFFYF